MTPHRIPFVPDNVLANVKWDNKKEFRHNSNQNFREKTNMKDILGGKQ